MKDVTPLIGEPLAVDLVNTESSDGDLLATPRHLGRWFDLQAGRLDETVSGLPDHATLDAVRRVRGHTRAALDALRRDHPPAAADLRALEVALAAAPARTYLAWDGTGVTATIRRAGAPADRLAAALAEAAIGLLCDPVVTKLRQCEADDCVMLFLPLHPRRRWCSADRCGNRVRVARYYQRRKHATGG